MLECLKPLCTKLLNIYLVGLVNAVDFGKIDGNFCKILLN